MARAKGRRRWTVRLVLLGALVWLLGWQGLGWLSGPGESETDEAARAEGRGASEDEDIEQPPEVPPGVPPGGTGEARTGEGTGDDQGGARQPVEAEMQTGLEPGQEHEAGDFAGGEDHVRALLRLTERAVETGMLGGGFQALDELDGLPIAAVQREESQEARAALEEHLREGVAGLREEILGGRVLAARSRLGDLLRIPHSAVARALDELARSQRWPTLRGDEAPSGYVPAPQPLQADRIVRFYRNGIEVRARVVDSTTEEITVHLRDERGVTYPSLRLTQVELPEADTREAADMGLAALRAGDALLARLWLCHGLSQGGGPRCRELADLLG